MPEWPVARATGLFVDTSESSAIDAILEQSADDLGAFGWEPGYGWGRVNAAEAVRLALDAAYVSDTTESSVSTIARFTTQWNSRQAVPGHYSLQCRAYDIAGNSSWSPVVVVLK